MKSVLKGLLLFVGLLAIFTTCDTAMGFGDPIDLIAPILTIDFPSQNENLGRMYLDQPLEMHGTWRDQSGIAKMEANIILIRTGETHLPVGFEYELFEDGTWKADLYLPAFPDTFEGDEFKI